MSSSRPRKLRDAVSGSVEPPTPNKRWPKRSPRARFLARIGESGTYWRTLEFVAILDALGRNVLPVVGRLTRADDAVASVTIRPQGDAAAKVTRPAASTGTTPHAVVEATVDAAS